MGAALYADWVNLNSFEIHPFVDWMNWVFFLSEKCSAFGNTCCGNMENGSTTIWHGTHKMKKGKSRRHRSSSWKPKHRYRSFGHFDCCCVCPQVCDVLKVKIGTPNSFHIIHGSDTRLPNTIHVCRSSAGIHRSGELLHPRIHCMRVNCFARIVWHETSDGREAALGMLIHSPLYPAKFYAKYLH